VLFLLNCNILRIECNIIAGEYNFGYIDESAYTGNIAYVPCLPRDKYWVHQIFGFSFDNG